MTPRFEEVIDRHHDELFSYLWRLIGEARGSDPTLNAEDLVQEVFMRAYTAFPRLRPNTNHRAWLYKIATHCAFTKLRQAKRRRETAATLSDLNERPSIFSDRMTPKQLRFAVSELSPKQKACVTLRYFHDLDYSEIAAIAGCSEMSARANVSQAIRRLRNAIKEY